MKKNSNYSGNDCLGNPINQLGINNTNTPTLSELAFSHRYSVGKNAVGGGNHNCQCKGCDCDCSCDIGKCKCSPNKNCGCKCTCCIRDNQGVGFSGGGYYIGVDNNKVGGLPEVVSYFDCNKPTHAPKNASSPVQPGFKNAQKAGAMIYRYITNPLTGRKVNINGKIGKKVLLNYLQQTGGMRSLDTAFTGSESVFDPNMSNREFGCRQPQWDPKCV